MLITGIKSKPVYTPLAPDVVGHTHLLVGFGVGGDPLLRLVGELAGSGSTRSSRQLYYVSDPKRYSQIFGRPSSDQSWGRVCMWQALRPSWVL